MAAPFYNNIRGTTSGAPGAGAFTPNAAASGYYAWSTVFAGWIGLVRFDDGAAHELRYSYWNGTTLSRGTNAFVSSSSGSALSLSSSATATMIADAASIQPHLGDTRMAGWFALVNSTTTPSLLGSAAIAVTGTATAAALATTNALTELIRHRADSATTANAQAGWTGVTQALYSTAAGRGGFEFTCLFGAQTLPTGPRLFMGLTGSTFGAQTIEPSAFTQNYAVFGKDSTDTNIQLLTNSNAGSGTKIDTGIALVAGGIYEASIWAYPGGGTIYGLLIRRDTGEIWYGSTSTDIPVNGTFLLPQGLGGLNGTNTGTAFIMCISSMTVRTAS